VGARTISRLVASEDLLIVQDRFAAQLITL
jgi:hypothetical protein